MTDTFHDVGSIDYPIIERVFEGVPRAEVRKMLHENAKRLYQLDHVPDRLPS